MASREDLAMLRKGAAPTRRPGHKTRIHVGRGMRIRPPSRRMEIHGEPSLSLRGIRNRINTRGMR